MDGPNFLLIITDQHRRDHLGCYGHPVLQTPHIDALAERGVRFDRFYVTTPVCMPNRAALMTGRMPSVNGVRHNGIPLSRSATTFVELLRAGGYHTGLIGKSHLQTQSGRPPKTRSDGETSLHLPPPPELADAEAICEAVRRPTMRFVPVKSAKQQGRLMQHRTRDLLIRQRTQLINAFRSHFAELGIIAPQGRDGIKQLLAIVAEDEGARLPVDAHASLIVLAAQLQALQTLIATIEKRVTRQHRANDASQRLESIPGIGVLGATAITAVVPDPGVFRSGRDFAARQPFAGKRREGSCSGPSP